MINIENTYVSYDELVECIGEDVVHHFFLVYLHNESIHECFVKESLCRL